jgi:hypothetical protein
VAQIEAYFTTRYEDSELVDLAELLARVDGADSVDCATPD